MPLLFIFLLFFNTAYWHWWDSQVCRLFNYVSFLKSRFELVVRLVLVNARKRLAMLSDSESELFVTQRSFSGSTSIELSGNNFESLFADANNEN